MPTLVLLGKGPGLACSVRTHVVRSLLIRSRVQTFFLFILLFLFLFLFQTFFPFYFLLLFQFLQLKLNARPD
jgi:hypothetical protein